MKVIAMDSVTWSSACYYRLEGLTGGMFRTACYKEGVFSWATTECNQKWKAIAEYNAIRGQLKFV